MSVIAIMSMVTRLTSHLDILHVSLSFSLSASQVKNRAMHILWWWRLLSQLALSLLWAVTQELKLSLTPIEAATGSLRLWFGGGRRRLPPPLPIFF